MAVTLEVTDVGKDFLIPIIDRVSFTAEAGEFVCLLGPNGCGKTTLLRIIGGLEAPTRGHVLLGGEPVAGDDRHRRTVGVVFQEDRLLPWLTVRRNVELVLKPRGLAATERRETAARYLRMVGLAGFEDYYPGRVSGGMRQRAAIARALAVEPDVLLMDEPASALDPIATAKIEELIHELKAEYTIVIVTHNMQQAARVSDATAYFYLGRLIEVGPTEQIFTNPSRPETEDYVTGRFG